VRYEQVRSLGSIAKAAASPPHSKKFCSTQRHAKDVCMSVHTFSSPSAAALLVTLAPVLVQFVVFLRWLHRRMRNDEITRAFVRDIATNHLPHIYNALQKIAAHQGIALDETPLVQFVDLNHHRRRS
jgi:hypothetical protein